MLLPIHGARYNAPLGIHLCNHSSLNIFMPCCNVLYAEILDAALACYKLLVNCVDVFNLLQLYACCLVINAGEVARTQSGGECDGLRALAAVSPGCLVTVVKSHRTWIPTLRFHPPA